MERKPLLAAVPEHTVFGNAYGAFSGSGEVDLGRSNNIQDIEARPGDLQGDVPQTRTYKARFWILAMYSILCFLHVWQWNNWGPISETALKVFSNWDKSTVAMLANWSTITFVVFIFPICWLNYRYGLRVSILLCAILMAAGGLVRCVYINDTVFLALSNLSAFLIGIPGTLALAAPSVLAATWFPPHERTTATAFSQVICQLGGVGSYLEPLIVRSPSSGASKEELFDDVMMLMYICAGVNVVFLVMVVVYFPKEPKIPPSISSSMDNIDFMPSIKGFLKSKSAWMITISYGINTGVSVIWVSVMNIVIFPLGIDMDEAMILGVIAIFCSGMSALIAGRLTDRLSGHIKASLMGLMICSLACYFWLFLLTTNAITAMKWEVYVSITLGMSFSFAAVPLFFELTVEILYPCSDIVCGAFLTFLENFVGIIFLLIFFIDDIGYSWVVYALLGANAFALVPILFVQENYKRSDVDKNITNSPPISPTMSVPPSMKNS
ncbi:solute carrier family 49 member 4 homolog isoform X2 [Oratosquilla oratoria]|uniref:solute carrier family 49 member 4 homolog isoform X2 n=1 Tax=Oratosquilla oratoria TaxID=337810 RepID=UPI003F76CF9F